MPKATPQSLCGVAFTYVKTNESLDCFLAFIQSTVFDAGFALSIRISARSITPDHFPKSSRYCPLVGGIKIVNFL